MTVGILMEKPSAARNGQAAWGGASGTFNGEKFVVAHARGHLYEFAAPDRMVDLPLAERYAKWDLANLPWDLDGFSWALEPIRDTASVRGDLRAKLAGCDEIAIATDNDPGTFEGDAIAIRAIIELGLDKPGVKFSRLFFTDESPKSLQHAFVNRTPIASLADYPPFRTASYRASFDFASMQFTRLASVLARQSGQDLVLRQGRLKSAMVKLVGDQQKAHIDYVKRPFWQSRFRDENGVMYTNPGEPRFSQQDQVPQQYSPSPVALDTKTDKRTAPPKLLDLAALSSMLVGKGVKAKLTLATYQKMYEDQVVSYPRTGDKTITPGQFDEHAPLVDRIAAVAGVDTALLTHRKPRPTHVKPDGAHGANRPGPKVPASLDDIEQRYGKVGRLIYGILARNYLAMLAGDYLYEQQKGHVARYPDFVGIANVPQSQGWKAVFDPEAGDDAAEDNDGANSKGLGSNAEPFVFEGANKRPEHPSMKWLMKQLEKRDVGTGATRTSTYAEVTSTTAKYPLLSEQGRKLTLAQAGEMSWRLLPGTHIGALSLTEKVHQDMRDIAGGKTTGEACLRVVADWVREDIATMQKNAAAMRSDLGLKETQVSAHAEGIWLQAPGGPKKIAFRRIWSGHEFSGDEVVRLLAGETISFQATSKAGKPYTATGALGIGDFKGRKFVGFQPEVPDKPGKWSGRIFTPEEIDTLLAGHTLEIADFVSARSGKRFGCKVSWDAKAKKIRPDFGSGDEPPLSWCQVKFTRQQRADLAAGKTIQGSGFVSARGKSFDARICWRDEGGKKKIIPSFA
ncbi:DNA topoisomerase [Arthrobacter sp. NPDC056691]|uniref:DNA topoisomerase n=1 Tax=Arthrobacter sp. NPDC056691 TaxID=3345913 RepID=UPI00366DC8E1